MGISADLVIFSEATQINFNKETKDGIDDYLSIRKLSENNFSSFIVDELKEFISTEYVKEKVLFYIGDSSNFYNILDDYEKNEGILKFKNYYTKIDKDTLEQLFVLLKKKFYWDKETILSMENLYINLNY